MLIKLLDVVFGKFNSLSNNKQVVRYFKLINKRNIYSFNALSNILIFNIKVLAYSAFIANCRYVFVINGFKVLILLYLYKGNYNTVSFDNSFIKLKVISGIKSLTFLCYELCLF
jgi:hypothetical protein